MLFELVKLSSEVRQLNSETKLMREAMGTVSSGPITAKISVTVPELDHGLIKTCENLKKFLDRSRNKDVQIFLVRLCSSLKFRR